jgi:general secretion pathway protein M
MNKLLLNLQESWQESTAPLRQRWLLLASREQQALKILGIFSVLLFLVYGLWLPSRHVAEAARAQYENNRELLYWMQTNASQLGQSTMNAGTGSILGTVSNTANTRGLTLSRIEPEGEGQVRVWVERADFNAISTWLTALSVEGIKVREAQADKQNDGNGVSARFVLSR